MATDLIERPQASLIEGTDAEWAAIERVLIGGDLARLSAEQRVEYYGRVCRSLQLNPLTRPFEYITLNSKLVLYARRDATDQLRSVRRVSVTGLETRVEDDLAVVVAHGRLPDGRTDQATGVVAVKGLQGESRANALMKAETKAKRRMTLSICGLGFMDESEVGDTGPGGSVDPDTAEVAPSNVAEALAAAKARETASEAAPQPQAAEEAPSQLPDATSEASEAPGPSETPTDERPRISQADLTAWIVASRIPVPKAQEVRLTMFPDPKVDLDDYQRAELQAALEPLAI